MNRAPTTDALGLHERASATPSLAEHRHLTSLGRAPAWTEAPLSLALQQQWFAEIVSTPESEPAPVDERSAARLIAPSATLSALERIQIYRRGYHARLIECLIDDYPVLEHALGEESFEALCRAYIARHPSAAPSLNYFGQHMADFCRTQALPNPGFASDLAQLEWAIVLCIHAETARTIGAEDLARVPSEAWPNARFKINPSLRLLRLDHPVNAYLQAYRDGKPDVLAGGTPRSNVIAVYRTGTSVWRMELDPALVTLVEALSAGLTLESALSEVQALLADKSDEEAGRIVARSFEHCVSSGLLSGLDC